MAARLPIVSCQVAQARLLAWLQRFLLVLLCLRFRLWLQWPQKCLLWLLQRLLLLLLHLQPLRLLLLLARL